MASLNNKISIFIDEELKRLKKKEFAKSRNRLVGEKVISYGVKTSKVRRIIKSYFRQFKEEIERDWSDIVEELMSTKIFEDQMAGIFLLGLLVNADSKISIPEIEKLIREYIDNWATCDTMSSEVVARRLENFPKGIEVLYTFANSKNIWLRRVALVTTVKLKNKVEEWQKIASKVLSFYAKEKTPIVKKAVHWLKKEIK